MKVGLALGGGGARGLAHVGVLKVLEAERIPVNVICGTSMGSVIGAMYAYDPDAKRLENRVRDYYSGRGVKGSWLEFLSREPEEYKKNIFLEMSYYIRKKYMALVALRKVGLENTSTLREPLQELLVDTDIENLKIPYAAAAINLTGGKDAVIRSGSLIDAVYASSSIEGVFPPIEKNGDLYSDGGPTSNIPVEACREMGADFVIAVYLPVSIQREEGFSNGLEVILRADNIAATKLSRILLDTADIAVIPEVRDIHWAAFQKIDECIKLGADATKEALPEIKMKLRKQRSMFAKFRRYLKSRL